MKSHRIKKGKIYAVQYAPGINVRAELVRVVTKPGARPRAQGRYTFRTLEGMGDTPAGVTFESTARGVLAGPLADASVNGGAVGHGTVAAADNVGTVLHVTLRADFEFSAAQAVEMFGVINEYVDQMRQHGSADIVQVGTA